MSIVVDDSDKIKTQTNQSEDKKDLLSPEKNKDSQDLTANINNDYSNDIERPQSKNNE